MEKAEYNFKIGKLIGVATRINDPVAWNDGWVDSDERQEVLESLPSKVFESEEVNDREEALVYVENLKGTVYPLYLVIEKIN